jgi:hypothetical protein
MIKNLIQMNKFSYLHNDEDIIFCKRDFLLEEFLKLSTLNKKNIILIVANSDTPFTEDLLSYKPDNVKHIFATNSMVYNDIVTPIPIGVENSIPCKREGHGIINDEIFEKLPFLTEEIEVIENYKNDKLYANFNINTNLGYRTHVKNICLNSDSIVFEYGLSYFEYVKKIKKYLAVISPTGNGIECLRTYEILYLNSIPVCVGDFNLYKAIYEKIYKNLPIVFINSPEDLVNINEIKIQISKVKNRSKEMLEYDYWENEILKKVRK